MESIIDIVVVTYNRLEKLKTALDSYDRQTYPFRNLIVVDNCSTDGTKEFLERWKNEKSFFGKNVIGTSCNVGGSGGFFLGQKMAVESGADWVYVADDDAYADIHLIEQFNSFLAMHCGERFSAICASVKSMNGLISTMHRGRWRLKSDRYFERYSVPVEEYSKDFFTMDLLSYVGSFLNVDALRKVGMVNQHYFISYDDTEHSFRLKKYGDIVCVPKMVVSHDSNNNESYSSDLNWRDYYMIRNSFHMQLKHMPRIIVFRMVLSFIIKGGDNISSDKTFLKVYRDAVKDALLGHLGIHDVYRPGWVPNLG